MGNGRVGALYISSAAGGPMQLVGQVHAIAGLGLKGDRYGAAAGSYNRGKPGSRQVTLINGIFFVGSGFDYADSRRNIVTFDIELMWLIGREFHVGAVLLRGIKYCDPCERPTKLSGNARSFKEAFHDRGGLIAEVIESGLIKVNDEVVPPPKGY